MPLTTTVTVTTLTETRTSTISAFPTISAAIQNVPSIFVVIPGNEDDSTSAFIPGNDEPTVSAFIPGNSNYVSVPEHTIIHLPSVAPSAASLSATVGRESSSATSTGTATTTGPKLSGTLPSGTEFVWAFIHAHESPRK